jgi:hypothetical protein
MLDPTFTPNPTPYLASTPTHTPLLANGLAQQNLRMTRDDVVGQLTHDLITEALVQLAGTLIERGDAHENVGRLTQNTLFRELDQSRPESLPPPVRLDQDCLDVADKRAGHAENQESGQPGLIPGHVYLAGRILYDSKRVLIRSPQGQPRLRARHQSGAGLRFGFRLEASYRQRWRGDHGRTQIHVSDVTPVPGPVLSPPSAPRPWSQRTAGS